MESASTEVVTEGSQEADEHRRSRPRAEDVPTRLPVAFWDRIKILFLLILVWGILLVAAKGDNPLLTWPDDPSRMAVGISATAVSGGALN